MMRRRRGGNSANHVPLRLYTSFLGGEILTRGMTFELDA